MTTVNETTKLMENIGLFSVAAVAAFVEANKGLPSVDTEEAAYIEPVWVSSPSFVVVVESEDSVEEFSFECLSQAKVFFRNCVGNPTLWSWENIGASQYAYVEVDVA